MTDSMTQALKEGISVNEAETDLKATEGAESSPAKQETTKDITQSEGTAQQPLSQKTSETNVPFDQHPRFKALYRQTKELERRNQEMERRYTEQMEKLTQSLAQRNGPQTQSIPNETQQALLQLADLLKQSPEAMERLGLSQVSSRAEALEQQLEQIQEYQTKKDFNFEFDEVLKIAEGFGLNKDEVTSELAEYIENHPVLSQVQFSKGAVMMAFRDKYWERIGEFKERSINQKIIQDREKKKSANSEIPGHTSSGGKNLPSSMRERMEDLIREGGGVSI